MVARKFMKLIEILGQHWLIVPRHTGCLDEV